MKKLIIAGLLLSFSINAVAQGYDIDFKINGLKDTTVYLGHFYGESTYVKDTARVNSLGEFSFEGSTMLPPGIYFLVMNKTRLFDVVINEDQQFKISADASSFVPTMKVEGDIENELFLKNLFYNAERNEEATPFVAVLESKESTEAEKSAARAGLQKINEKVKAYQKTIIQSHPESVIAKIFKANMPVDIPEPPAGADSTFAYKYYRDHYWDNFDLADETLIRVSGSIYRKKVEDYLDRMLMQHPDTIMNAIDEMAAVAKKNPETYKYLIWTVTLKYQQPEIMGLDEVYVNIYDKYFASGEMDYWANASLKKNLKEQAEKYRLSLIGKKGQNLIMLDQNLKPQELYKIKNKYTILFFFDPDCSYCKKETPILKEFYDNTNLDVEVFAVSADTSMTKMKNYIKDMGMNWITVNGPRTYTKPYQELYDSFSTPTIYILDEEKKIIAKKLSAARIEEFLKNYDKLNEHKR